MFKKVISYFIIVLMVMLIANRAIYVHSHVLSNGIVVPHAHPYSKDQSNDSPPNHQHSSYEFLVLHQLLILFTVLGISCLIVQLYSVTHFYDESIYSRFIVSASIVSLRGPPILINCL
jgi:hypothetical protein